MQLAALISPAVPLDEPERQRRLAELALMEEPAHPQFAKICDLAATMFSVPYAFVSLIDATRAHVFAECGLGPGSMPRGQAMCDTTIAHGRPLVIPELTEDPRFRDTPLVTGEAAMRFYAGVPIEVAPGIRLGAFCIADRVRHDLGEAEIASLQALCALVVEQIDHHDRRQRLERVATELAGRQAILTQTEQLARIGGFELEPASGTMAWSDGLRRLLGGLPEAEPSLAAFLACFGDAEPLAAAIDKLGRAAGGAVLDLETEFAPVAGPRFVHVHAERHVAGTGSIKLVGIVQDVTERKRAIAELEWTAAHDALTGLLNRAAFTAATEEAMRRAELLGDRVALIMVDVDRFKLVNDTLGHDVGDAVLLAVAARLKGVAGARGTVGRIGGDEFAVLVAGYAAEGTIAAVATQLLLELRRPLHHRSGVLGTRATLGIALRTPGLEEAGDLFKAADLALYHAKDAGRDGFAFFMPTMREEMGQKLNRLTAARDAVAADRIEPYYQPKICLASGRIAGFEALLRWHHPEHGLRPPGEIADAFADSRLATDIGRVMLHRAAADMVAWRDAGVPFRHVALNVAEAELTGGDYADRLLSCLAAHGLSTDELELEVTESVFLGQASGGAARKLADLAAAGLRIALDDFGTGYASLTHLKHYPVSAIKIDRSFVTDIESDRHDAMIVEALTTLANSLEIEVVAEGIETASQAQYLRRRRCTMGQGYLFARPMAASRVPHFVRTWNERIPRKPLRQAG